MRFILLSILFLGHFCFAGEQAKSEKLLEKHIGKWEMVISGDLLFKNQEPKNLHFVGMLDAKPLYENKFIVQRYLSKGKDFEGQKKDSENLEFLFFDKAKQKLVSIQFNTESASFTQLFKINSEEQYSGILKEKPQVKMSHSIEFLNGGKERIGYYATQNDLIEMTLNMNWNGNKVEKFQKKFQFAKIDSKDKDIEKFKTEKNKWILKGFYLYEEVREGAKAYTEVIGKMIGKKVIRKYQFHSDGKVMAYEPKTDNKKTIWQKVDYEYKIPEM